MIEHGTRSECPARPRSCRCRCRCRCRVVSFRIPLHLPASSTPYYFEILFLQLPRVQLATVLESRKLQYSGEGTGRGYYQLHSHNNNIQLAYNTVLLVYSSCMYRLGPSYRSINQSYYSLEFAPSARQPYKTANLPLQSWRRRFPIDTFLWGA